MAKFGKKNHVSLNPLDANICLLGTPKVGKTTLMKEVAEELVGSDGYLFLEMYRENGAKYIEDIVYENVPNWETFIEIIDDIIDNRTTDYAELKVVFIDTLDNALQLAEQESIRLWNKENPGKKTNSINSAWGGFMKGQDKACDLLQEQFFRLREVGIAPSYIGHVRTTNVTDPITLENYQQLTSDVTQRYFGQIKKNIDLVALAYIDREIVTQRNDNGGNKKVNKVESEVRKIKFRDSNYAVDAGGRFRYIQDECDFTPSAFITAMRDALETEVKSKGKSVESRKEEDVKREKQKFEEVAKQNEEAKSDKNQLAKIVSDIIAFVSENKSNTDVISVIMEACRERGYANPKEISDVNDAKAILARISVRPEGSPIIAVYISTFLCYEDVFFC